MIDDDLQSELELVEHDNGEGYRTTYELRMNYVEAGERWHETIEDGLTKGDLWSHLYQHHRQLAREEQRKVAEWHREKLGVVLDDVPMGPVEHHEDPANVYELWEEKAATNIDEWGLQDRETLLLAMQEELGELSKAFLEAEHEGRDPDRIGTELDDLAALVIQFRARLASDV